jgi:hypothetical protein
VGAEIAELMGPHVLQTEAHACCFGQRRDFLQRKIPLAVVGNPIVYESD